MQGQGAGRGRRGAVTLRRSAGGMLRHLQCALDAGGDGRDAVGGQAQFDGDLTTSVTSYRQALDLLRKCHGEEHPFTGWGYLLLGEANAEAGQLTIALVEMRQGIAILDRTLSPQNPRYLVAKIAYSRILDATGSHSEAAQIRAASEPLLKDIYRKQCVGCTVSAIAFH